MGDCVLLLVVAWGSVAQRRMQSHRVVEACDVVGNVSLRFGVIGVSRCQTRSIFRFRKNRSMTALSQQLPLRLMLHTRPWRESSAVWAWLAYWLPRSECTSSPGAGCRLTMARFKAVQTNSAGMLGAIAQPTILRENRSSTTARYNQPLRVRM